MNHPLHLQVRSHVLRRASRGQEAARLLPLLGLDDAHATLKMAAHASTGQREVAVVCEDGGVSQTDSGQDAAPSTASASSSTPQSPQPQKTVFQKKTHHLFDGLPEKMLRQTIAPYLEHFIRHDDGAGDLASRVTFTAAGFSLEPFEVVQSTLVALMGGVCKAEKLRIGRCDVRVPRSVWSSSSKRPVVVRISDVQVKEVEQTTTRSHLACHR